MRTRFSDNLAELILAKILVYFVFIGAAMVVAALASHYMSATL